MAIYLKNIDLSNNQLQNAALHPTGVTPTGAVQGQVYFHTTTKDLWYHDNVGFAPVRVAANSGLSFDDSTPAAPKYNIDFTVASLAAVTTNTTADIFAIYDASLTGHRSITFGNLESNLSTANMSDTANIVYNNQVNTYTVGKQSFIGSTTGTASIRIQSGVDPTTPVQGDVWLQTNNLKYRDSTTVRTLIYSGGAFHDGFSDFVTNEHIDHSTITIAVVATTDETSVVGAAQAINANVSHTIGLADNAIMPGTGGMIPVSGTTAQRVVRTGNFRYNSTNSVIEWYNGTAWVQPDTGGGQANQNAFAIVTGDTGTATADAVSDTLAVTTGTGLVTLGVAGAAAGLTINHDIVNITNTPTATGDVLLLGDITASSGIIKRDVATFITDQNIALLASPVFTGNPVAPTPTQGDNDTSLATTEFVKIAVDAAQSGIDYKESSILASSGSNIAGTYSNTGGTSGRGRLTAITDTVDSVTVVVGDRILLKDQTAGAQNGIWEVLVVGTGATGEWERATDFDSDADVTSGAYTYIEEGTVNATSGWTLTTNDPIVIGGASGTALTFAQVSGAGQITAGAAMTKTGNTLDVIYDSVSIDVDGSDQLRIDPTWIGQGAITTVGTLAAGSIGATFTAIIDARLATITTANKVSGSAVQLSATSAIENSVGLRLKATLAGNALTMTSQVLDVISATNTVEGVIETATAVEAEAATDPDRAVTPLGLASYTRMFTKACAALATTTVTHGLGHRNVTVEVYRTGTPWDTVHCDVARTTTNTVDVTITPTPSAGLYTIVVTGPVTADAV